MATRSTTCSPAWSPTTPTGRSPTRSPSRSSLTRTARSGPSSSRTGSSPTASAVTADSFVKAWNYGANPDNKQLNNYFFYPIEGTDEIGNTVKGEKTVKGLKVVDDKTFTITLKSPESDFPLRLGYSAYFPVPDSAYGTDGKITKEYGERPIGNGPYKLTKTGWERNKQISLVPNKDYTGIHKPKNGGLTFKFFNSTDSAYSDVQAGNLDVLDQVPPSALTTFEKDDSVKAYNEPGSNFSSITIPERLPHFVTTRKASCVARPSRWPPTARRSARRSSTAPARRRPTSRRRCSMAGPRTSRATRCWTFNPNEAKRLWAEANKISKWSGKFVLAYNNDGAGNKEFSEAMTNQLKNNLGIDAAPKIYATFDELRTDITDRSIKTPFRTGWQADYPSMLNYLGPIYATGAGSNDGDYSNKQFDKLVSEAAAAKGDARYKLIGEAQTILLKDLPALPLWYQNATAVTGKDLKGFEFNWKQKPDYYALTK